MSSLFFSPMFSRPTNLGHTTKTITKEVSKRLLFHRIKGSFGETCYGNQVTLENSASFGDSRPKCGALLGHLGHNWPFGLYGDGAILGNTIWLNKILNCWQIRRIVNIEWVVRYLSNFPFNTRSLGMWHLKPPIKRFKTSHNEEASPNRFLVPENRLLLLENTFLAPL